MSFCLSYQIKSPYLSRLFIIPNKTDDMDTLINHRYVTTSHTAYPIFATFRLVDESTRQREFSNLLAIRNNYPKYAVSLDE